jgi:polyferredoxin
MSHVIGYLQIGTILFILTFLSRLRYLWVNEVRSAETLAQGLTALFKFGLGLAFLTVLFWPIMVPLVFYWVVIEGRRNKAEDQPEPVFTPDRHCLLIVVEK